jgi:hypothetical protein
VKTISSKHSNPTTKKGFKLITRYKNAPNITTSQRLLMLEMAGWKLMDFAIFDEKLNEYRFGLRVSFLSFFFFRKRLEKNVTSQNESLLFELNVGYLQALLY